MRQVFGWLVCFPISVNRPLFVQRLLLSFLPKTLIAAVLATKIVTKPIIRPVSYLLRIVGPTCVSCQRDKESTEEEQFGVISH